MNKWNQSWSGTQSNFVLKSLNKVSRKRPKNHWVRKNQCKNALSNGATRAAWFRRVLRFKNSLSMWWQSWTLGKLRTNRIQKHSEPEWWRTCNVKKRLFKKLRVHNSPEFFLKFQISKLGTNLVSQKMQMVPSIQRRPTPQKARRLKQRSLCPRPLTFFSRSTWQWPCPQTPTRLWSQQCSKILYPSWPITVRFKQCTIEVLPRGAH